MEHYNKCLICLEEFSKENKSTCCSDARCVFCKDCLKGYLESAFIEKAKMGVNYPMCPGLCKDLLTFKSLKDNCEEEIANKVRNFYIAHTKFHCPGCDGDRIIATGDINFKCDDDDFKGYFNYSDHIFKETFDDLREKDPYALITLIKNTNKTYNNILIVSCCRYVVCIKCLDKIYPSDTDDFTTHVCRDTKNYFNVKLCPGCETPFVKTNGCSTVTCVMCSMKFCSECLKPMKEHTLDCIRSITCHGCKDYNYVRLNTKDTTCVNCSESYCSFCQKPECYGTNNCEKSGSSTCRQCNSQEYKSKIYRTKCSKCNHFSCMFCNENGCSNRTCCSFAKKCENCHAIMEWDTVKYPVISCKNCEMTLCKSCYSKNCNGICVNNKIYCIGCSNYIKVKKQSYASTLDNKKDSRVSCGHCNLSFCRLCISIGECTKKCSDTSFNCTMCIHLIKNDINIYSKCISCEQEPVNLVHRLYEDMYVVLMEYYKETKNEIKNEDNIPCKRCNSVCPEVFKYCDDRIFCKSCDASPIFTTRGKATLIKQYFTRLSKRTTTKEH